MATEATAAVRRGFDVPCPLCGEDGRGGIILRVHDTAIFGCTECDRGFSAGDLRAAGEQMVALADWADTAPAREE
jgi:hypothetical protein